MDPCEKLSAGTQLSTKKRNFQVASLYLIPHTLFPFEELNKVGLTNITETDNG